jgi:hypothetical protein
MKSQIVKLIAIVVFLLPAMLQAQTTIDKLYEKYAGQKGFTSINISPEMFKMLAALDTDNDSAELDNEEQMLSKLSGLKMLIYEPGDGPKVDFANEVKSTIKMKDYSELMSVDSEDETVKFLVKKAPNNRFSEMLMIVLSSDETLVMSMTGNLDMATISSISKSLDIQGMDKLDELDKK